MLRIASAMFIIGGMAAWGQTQNDGGPDKVDRATAYYHYTLARMYAEKAATQGGSSRDYVNQAIENYRAAIKADPQTAMLKQELSKLYTNGATQLLRPPPQLLAVPPGQKLPKTAP
jgi:hypothetical protein